VAPSQAVVDFGALELEGDGRGVVLKRALGLAGFAQEVGAGETSHRVGGLETERLIEIGEGLVGVARGSEELAASVESGDVRGVGGKGLGVGSDRLGGLSGRGGADGALHGSLGFLFVRLGVGSPENAEDSRKGKGYEADRAAISDRHLIQCTLLNGRTIWAIARYDELVTWR
jgi:hypothetical protein